MNSRLLITLSVFLFLATGTFIAIRWAQGYRFNMSKKVIEGTGLLVANSEPKGASVFIDDKLRSATDDTLHLPPGQYKIRLEKEGYHTWEKTLQVEKELVTQTNAKLFPAVPNLSALTVNGAFDAHPSPDGNRIAFKTASGSARTKHGIWVLNLNDSPLKLGSTAIQIAQDTDSIKFSEAQIFWTPNSSEILAYFNENRAYLLNATTQNKSQNLINVAFQLPMLISEWQQQLGLEREKRIAKLPLEMQKIATESATLLYFSPNEEKLLYTATESATIPQNLIPPLPAVNSQPQTRELTSGSIYVYDLKEDTNFLLKADAFDNEALEKIITTYSLPEEVLNDTLPTSTAFPAITPTPKTAGVPQSILSKLQGVQAQYSPVYSLKYLQWFPNSSHLIYVEKNGISIMEYDGTNKVTVFPGVFAEDFTYPWPNGQKLVLLTSLTTNPEIMVNFYSLNLQ
ncbi:MAG: PEGA domain-containing protein [Patescibacteria group bacterium]|jgi:hypothetical protein